MRRIAAHFRAVRRGSGYGAHLRVRSGIAGHLRGMDRLMREVAGEVLRVINGRTSYRGRYKNSPVPEEDLLAVIRAGISAPSGCGMKTASFIAVDDPEVLFRIKAAIAPPICETAPAVIAVLTRKIIAYRGRCFNVQDYSAAIENMLLAIKALGYESCWYEGHLTDEDDIAGRLARELGVPPEYSLVCILPIGVPDEPVPQPSGRDCESRVWRNRFGRGFDC